jgi:hypothetical protein
MMCVEVLDGPQCRVGLTPTVSLVWPPSLCQAAMVVACLRRVPWVAISGSHAVSVVITACRCRRIAAAITICAWVAVSRLVSRVVRCR